MIYQLPALSAWDESVLVLIHEQRTQLYYYLNQNPDCWSGFLRRDTFARAIQGSNSIEGYNATADQAVAIIDDEKPEALYEETARALIGYRNAVTYILQTHDDLHFELHPELIKSLHFMTMNYDLSKMPGQWRPGVFVVDEDSDQTLYEGPDAELIPDLISELILQLTSNKETNSLVLGAMAHLNLAMIRPFKDGNGRMARALQTLVLARSTFPSPTFNSIEEWLGRNTQAYCDILASVGQGKWNPHHDALPWVRFCLRAHYQQAATLNKRSKEVGKVLDQVSCLIVELSLPERAEFDLMRAAFGHRITYNRYRSFNDISDAVASRDLKRLTDAELLIPHGEKRDRYYTASGSLRAIREMTRDARPAPDPYELVQRSAQPSLSGLD